MLPGAGWVDAEPGQLSQTLPQNGRLALPENNNEAKESLINSGSPLAFRAVHTQGAALQEGWLPFKKVQRRVWIALKTPKGVL
ncbi:hypothetical protein GCM10022265_00880 [Marinobacter xestospongiae]